MKRTASFVLMFMAAAALCAGSTAARQAAVPGAGAANTFGVPALAVTEYVFMYSTEPELKLEIENAGGGILSWSIGEIVYKKGTGWIEAVAPLSGETEFADNATVSVDREELPEGIYTAIIPITSNGGSANVTLNMDVLWPAVSPGSVTLGTGDNSTSFTIINPSADVVSWEASVSYGQSAGGQWMSVSPVTGDIRAGDNETVLITVTRQGLSPGEYRASVTLGLSSDSYAAERAVDIKMNVGSTGPDHICAAEYILGSRDPRLEIIRALRDAVLLHTPAGRRLAKLYYQHSALCITYLKAHPRCRKRIRAALELLLPAAAGMLPPGAADRNRSSGAQSISCAEASNK